MDGLTQLKLYSAIGIFINILPDLIQIFLLWKIYELIKKDRD